ncbi:MAG TPA: hypothetical protein VKC15_13380 [Gemmatimonadales bacterium]|nr:hypothetical protein [Gemmatimonadales bacterium]
MKTWSSVLALAVLVVACDSATAPRSFRSTIDDSQVPALQRSAYREDATHLALRDLLASGYTEIAIPDDAVQPYYDALVLVHNATALPARDTVVDVYAVHAYPWPATGSMILELFDSEAWVQRLARGEVPTGEPTVDALMARYALSVGNVYRSSATGNVLLTLASPEPLNFEGLAKLFAGITGVRFAEPNGYVGDGNDIRGSMADARLLLDYSVGYGDCPAGCINRRSYHFAVTFDGTVEYLGASGSPPPPPPPPQP